MIEGIGSSGFSQGLSALWGGASRPDPARMARELFASTDADGSGSIDQEELSAALAGKSGDGKGPDAAELFSALDADGDGLITEEEHETGLAAMHKDLAQASMLTSVGMTSLADELFAATDADGDGTITEEELAAAVTARNEETDGAVDASELFAALDADGDGLITAAEHSAGLESLRGNNAGRAMGPAQGAAEDDEDETYDAADTNQDGVVDAAELLAALGGTDAATGAGGQKGGIGLAQSLMASKYAAYRLMGMDAQAYLNGVGFSATA